MSNKDSQDTFTAGGNIAKTDAGNQIIGGWFSVFKVDGDIIVDTDNEEIDIESYNKVFIEFSKNYRNANFDHGSEIKGSLIDNILIDTPEMAKMLVHEITGIPMDEIPVQKLGHFGSFQIHDKADFEDAVKNKLMFSIEGTCDRVEVDDDC
ncbi:MAG: hypothetical protein JKY62_16810 [Desulfocapsa sp.]|nr:hypothetical protein [Desulfocapsa sp.]